MIKMVDPYKVLGVPRNASEEQIKIAYRELAKKYHPDNYDKSPLKDLALEKMKEVNEAYDLIMNEKRKGRGSNEQKWANSGKYYSQGSSYPDIRELIVHNRFDDAEQILDGVPPSSRSAEWYFLKGTVLYRKGWLEEAYKHFESACRMDPNNGEYAAALHQMINQRKGNFMNYNMDRSMGCSTCDICTSFMCADMLCNCFGSQC
jgi:curved DNA-binding protein CbpA